MIPADGSKAAVAYWATRTREELRRVERMVAHDLYDEAASAAVDAAGTAGCLETAAHALNKQKGSQHANHR